MKLLRIISFPFVPIYYLIIRLRNLFYDAGIIKSKSYDIPIICVGNLSVGGTGKTPMVEYLINLLKGREQVATLSRGYKRKTKGFIIADNNASVETIGDEPMQFYSKFDEITVAVDADRQNGISKLIRSGVGAIILDDAYQHRKVIAGLIILLTTYSKPYFKDYMLPTGDLREPRSGAKRADIIVVTKCPDNISEAEKIEITKSIKPLKHQEVFFSWVTYDDMPSDIKTDTFFTLVTGIANPKPLIGHLKSKGFNFEHLEFKDHHNFSQSEIEHLKTKEVILTTEKDHMRLKQYLDKDRLFFLPMKSEIDRPDDFNDRITRFIDEFKKQ